jgi:hypothetical protein
MEHRCEYCQGGIGKPCICLKLTAEKVASAFRTPVEDMEFNNGNFGCISVDAEEIKL